MTETSSHNDEMLLRRYLLGEVSEEEQRAIEQRLLTDQDYFDCLLRAEEGLIDEHVQGRIRGREAQEFESRFLRNPARCDQVEFAKTFHRYLANQLSQREAPVSQAIVLPRWRLALEIGLACALIALGVFSLSLFRKVTGLREQVREAQSLAEHHAGELALQVKREQEQVEDLRQEVARLESASSGAATVASLVLVPGVARNADWAATVNLSSQTKKLKLVLQFDEGNYRAYRAELQTVEGTVVWTGDGLIPRKGRDMSSVDLTLPAELFTRSDYLIMLSGVNANGNVDKVATYYLNIVRKIPVRRP